VAVQVDPIKPTLKAPGTKRLKLKHDEPLSNFAFKFNLRRYTKETTWGPLEEVIAVGFAYTFKIYARDRFGTLITTVGRCRLNLSNPRRKRLELTT